jgi:hypothetical protein
MLVTGCSAGSGSGGKKTEEAVYLGVVGYGDEDKNIDNKNNIAVVRAVRPVLPPTDTPVPLSTKVVTVLVPKNEPATVAILSAYIILP